MLDDELRYLDTERCTVFGVGDEIWRILSALESGPRADPSSREIDLEAFHLMALRRRSLSGHAELFGVLQLDGCQPSSPVVPTEESVHRRRSPSGRCPEGVFDLGEADVVLHGNQMLIRRLLTPPPGRGRNWRFVPTEV